MMHTSLDMIWERRKVKRMDAKKYLGQLKRLDTMITNKLIEKAQWKAISLGTTAPLGGERVQTSGSQQKMADAIDRYIDIEAEIDAYIDKLVDTKKDVISVIEQLNTTEYDILHKVYVQYITLEDVAGMYGRSYTWVTTAHGRGIKAVQDILDARK